MVLASASIVTWLLFQLFVMAIVVTFKSSLTLAASRNVAIQYGDSLVLKCISDDAEFIVSWEHQSVHSWENNICRASLNDSIYASSTILPKEMYSCSSQENGRVHMLNIAYNYVAAGAYLCCIRAEECIAFLVNLFYMPLVEFTEAAAAFNFSYSGFMVPIVHLECSSMSHNCGCNRSQLTDTVTFNVMCICPMIVQPNLNCCAVINYTVPVDIRSRVQYRQLNNYVLVVSNWFTYTGNSSTSGEKSWSGTIIIVAVVVGCGCLVGILVVFAVSKFSCRARIRDHRFPFNIKKETPIESHIRLNLQEEDGSQRASYGRTEKDTTILSLLPSDDPHKHDRTEQLQRQQSLTQTNNFEISVIIEHGTALSTNNKVSMSDECDDVKFDGEVSDFAAPAIGYGSAEDILQRVDVSQLPSTILLSST